MKNKDLSEKLEKSELENFKICRDTPRFRSHYHSSPSIVTACFPMITSACFLLTSVNTHIRRETQHKYNDAKPIAVRIADFYGDNDGRLSKQELISIYDFLGIPHDKKLNYKQIKEYIASNINLIPKI